MRSVLGLHMWSERRGFTLVEVMASVGIISMAMLAVAGFLLFLSRSFLDEFSNANNQTRFNIITKTIYNDLVHTVKRDPADRVFFPIKDLESEGKVLVYQVLTPCEGSSSVYDPDGQKNLCYGNGFDRGAYIRWWLDDDNNLHKQIWNGEPGNGGQLQSDSIVARNVGFFVSGVDDEGNQDNAKFVGIMVRLTNLDSNISETVYVRLRGV